MANESTVDQQQLQSTIDELYRKLSELFPAQRDALRNALNTIQVGENQTLGMLAAADDLATAPIGDPAVLRDRLNLEAVLGALASLDTLAEAEVGDAAAVRQGLGLGALALLSSLDQADVGDAATARTNLGLGSAAQYSDNRYPKLSGGAAANFGAMPQVGGAYIIETGTTQNGRYTKFSDRTLICTIEKYVCTALDGYRFGGLWAFPAMFSLPPSLSYCFISPTGSVNDPFPGTGLSTYNSIFLTSALSEAAASLRIWNAGGSAKTSDTITVTMTATGYWK